jgi:bifunctional dethiobiotin synthetase / adenosylmethionine---8-amino-7-oxononanoate aminotransferase
LLRTPQIPRSDKSIVDAVKDLLTRHAEGGGRYALLETAGGVLSPSPSGSQQADLYRPLRLPTLLVGDSKLGGIGTTVSAFESLHTRGYDTQAVILFDNPKWGNHAYLKSHFHQFDLAAFSIPLPPPRRGNAYDDEQSMEEYYDKVASTSSITEILDLVHAKHFSRLSKLTSMPSHAESIIWHPFRQYGLPQTLTAIDSAHNDTFAAYTPPSSEGPNPTSSITSIQPSATPLLTPLIDGSASWWTQGLGHGNPLLALTAAHAAGRYGHVMFANAVHEPALDLAYDLLSTLGNPKLSRVFYTDNGSTGMEVAVKMALRASAVRYGWGKEGPSAGEGTVGVLGIRGSYHGDTIGVMNCSEASVFNEKVDWHRPWGFWFEPPTIKMVRGRWVLDIPDFEGAKGRVQVPDFLYESLGEVFDFAHGLRKKIAETYYTDYITSTLKRLVKEEGRRFGALIMEPVLMGAGGMVFVDPLFQRTLIRVIREDPSLIAPNASHQSTQNSSEKDWAGLPVIADEVFTGLYRLGRASSSSFLNLSDSTTSIDSDVAPDISVYAKLLTGGLLPLAITTASESIFDTFKSEKKSDALLHGHSYTAHAVGCAVAGRSLQMINAMAEGKEGEGWDGYKSAWQGDGKSRSPFSFFAPSAVVKLSHSAKVESVLALGTVLAVALRDQAGAGYSSNAAVDLQKTLLTALDGEGVGVHSRVLGNVLYLMTSLTTERDIVEGLERRLIAALC